ncbi:unnamed protein product [Amoebophrya sp. A120]|nr:unnamed protein product [Amoebophrya sp. A120]|eukprot:GSA120T00023656001.1
MGFLFATKVTEKDFLEHTAQIKEEQAKRDQSNEQKFQALRDQIAALEKKCEKRDDEISSFVRGEFKNGIDKKIDTAQQHLEQAIHLLQEKTENATAELERVLREAISTLQKSTTKRLDTHAADLKKMRNALSGKLFDLASYKVERERDRVNIVLEDDSTLNNDVEGESQPVLIEGTLLGGTNLVAGADADGAQQEYNSSKDTAILDDPASVSGAAEGRDGAGAGAQGTSSNAAGGAEVDDGAQPGGREIGAAVEQADAPHEGSTTQEKSASLEMAAINPPLLSPSNSKSTASRTVTLPPMPSSPSTSMRKLESYRPRTKNTAKRVKRVEWIVQDVQYKLQVYETGQPLYSPEFTVNLDPSKNKVLHRAKLIFYPRGSSIVAKPGFCSVFLQFPLDDLMDEVVAVDSKGNAQTIFPSAFNPPSVHEHFLNNTNEPAELAARIQKNASQQQHFAKRTRPPYFAEQFLASGPKGARGASPLDALLWKNATRGGSVSGSSPEKNHSTTGGLLQQGFIPGPDMAQQVGRFELHGRRNSFWFRYRLKVGNFESYEVLDTIYKGVDNFCEVAPEIDRETDSLTISVEFVPEPEVLDEIRTEAGKYVHSGQELLHHAEKAFSFPDSKEAVPPWERRLGAASGVDSERSPSKVRVLLPPDEDDDKVPNQFSPSVKQYYPNGRNGPTFADNVNDQANIIRDRDYANQMLSSTTEFVDKKANVFFPFEQLEEKLKSVGTQDVDGGADEEKLQLDEPPGVIDPGAAEEAAAA